MVHHIPPLARRPAGDRDSLFSRLRYVRLRVPAAHACPFPKLGSPVELAVLEKMHRHGLKLRDFYRRDGEPIYYHSGGRYWRKALPVKLSSHYREIRVSAACAPVVTALLNSQLFYWYWITNSNCMDVVAREVDQLPVFDLALADGALFSALRDELLASYDVHRAVRVRRGPIIAREELNIDVKSCKPVIDALDRALAACYGFDREELEFLIGYDIAFRMGVKPGRESLGS